MRLDSIKNKILELLSEDDYGFWELAWAIGIQSPEDEAIGTFYKVTADLVDAGVIFPKRRNRLSAKLEEVTFDRNELLAELHRMNKPDPQADYWFSTREF